LHGGKAECTACHQPHGFASVSQQQACEQCHRGQAGLLAQRDGHDRCLACHQGHPHLAELQALPCSSCHGSVHPNQGHAQCLSCHEPHAGAPRSAIVDGCGDCHRKQRNALAQGHQKCLGCHTPHAGSRKPEATCTSCHDTKARAPHGAIQGGCESCHSVHGAKPLPRCQSCHKPGSLPGLHSQPKHQQCAKCHEGAHDAGPFGERATCLSCHREQKDHEPTAASCQGCHIFRR
jgi:hypothetical protein